MVKCCQVHLVQLSTQAVTNLNQLKMIGGPLIQGLNLRYQIACNLFVTLPLQLSKKPKQTMTHTHKLFAKIKLCELCYHFLLHGSRLLFFPS